MRRDAHSCGDDLFQSELHMSFALPGKENDGHTDPGGDWRLSEERRGAVSEWEEEAGAVGFDPASISVSGFVYVNPF